MSADWYPWYPALYEADTLHLTAAQDGIYRRLIDWYMQKRRPLPDNDQALAAIARIGLDEWLANAEVVRAFFKSKKGELHHKRCNFELDKQDKRVRLRGEIAQKGAQARWSKTKNLDASGKPKAKPKHAGGTGEAMLNQCREDATRQDKTVEDIRESPPPPSLVAARDAPDGPAEAMVEAFLAGRGRHWPNDSRLPAPTLTLRSEAEQLVAKGGTPELVAEVLERCMAKAAAEGDGPPNSFRAYGFTLDRAIKGHCKRMPDGAEPRQTGAANGHAPILRRASIAERAELIEAEQQRLGRRLSAADRRAFLESRGIDPRSD